MKLRHALSAMMVILGLSITSVAMAVLAAPGTPDMTAATDSNITTDNNTNISTPTFVVTCVNGATVEFFANSTSVASTTCGGDRGSPGTTATGTLSSGLTDGSYTVNARQTTDGCGTPPEASDASDCQSAYSASITVVIDTLGPSAPDQPDLTTASDTGVSTTDNITNDNTPTITVACEANATVRLYSGATLLASSTCTSSTIDITTSTLADGTYAIKPQQIDVAGNSTELGLAGTLTITVDTVAPTLTSVTPADDSTDVHVATNLVLNFSGNVSAVTGKKLSIASSIGTTTVDVTGSRVTTSANQVTVDPSSDLLPGTGYWILLDSGAFRDTAGNGVAVISAQSTWNFTTQGGSNPTPDVPRSAENPSSGGGGRPSPEPLPQPADDTSQEAPAPQQDTPADDVVVPAEPKPLLKDLVEKRREERIAKLLEEGGTVAEQDDRSADEMVAQELLKALNEKKDALLREFQFLLEFWR